MPELTRTFSGKRNDEEGAKEKLYTYASHVIVDSFKVRFSRLTPRRCDADWLKQGLETTVVEADE